MSTNEARPQRSATAALVLIAAFAFLYLIRSILLPFVLPLVVAYVLEPLIKLLSARLRVSRRVVAGCVFLVLIGVLAFVGWLVAPVLVRLTARLNADLTETLAGFLNNLLHGHAISLFGHSLSAKQMAAEAIRTLQDWTGNGVGMMKLAALGIAVVMGAILSVVLFAYFLIDGPAIARSAFRLVPPAQRPIATRVLIRLDPILRRYFVGIALVVIYATCAAYLGLGILLGVRHALMLALITGFLELIPVVGPASAAIIAGLVATQEARSASEIVNFVIYAFALRISIDQFFGPLVLGKAASVSPVLVIFCFLAGGLLFGIVGVILAMPVALGIKTTLFVLYDEPRN